MIKKQFLLYSVILLLMIGCAYSWQYPALQEFSAAETAPSAQQCGECHAQEYATWKGTDHADMSKMQQVPVEQMRECGACHTNLNDHVMNVGEHIPPSLSAMSTTEQNTVCGACHYNYHIVGKKAINPQNRHGLLMSVGFDEEKKRQLSCLDCHAGHKQHSDMLTTIRAHTCFTCHKEAIVTMGVFQPLNYLTAGKTCLSCHPEHGGSRIHQAARMTTGIVALTCVSCHVSGVEE